MDPAELRAAHANQLAATTALTAAIRELAAGVAGVERLVLIADVRADERKGALAEVAADLAAVKSALADLKAATAEDAPTRKAAREEPAALTLRVSRSTVAKWAGYALPILGGGWLAAHGFTSPPAEPVTESP